MIHITNRSASVHLELLEILTEVAILHKIMYFFANLVLVVLIQIATLLTTKNNASVEGITLEILTPDVLCHLEMLAHQTRVVQGRNAL